MTTILVVEDERDIQRTLRQILEADGFAVRTAASAEEAEVELKKSVPSLVLLDVRLPGVDGFALCRRVRETPEWKALPVIFLTSKAQEAQKVAGFGAGGDDYVTKPFSALELLARVKAVLKRGRPEGSGGGIFTDGDVRVDLDAWTLKVAGEAVKATTKEIQLLALLMEKSGKILSRQFLMDRIWGRDYQKTGRTVDQHVYKIRKMLGPSGKKIVSVETMGYKWDGE